MQAMLRRSRGLVGRSIWVVVAIVLLQLCASVAFYSAIDRQTLRQERHQDVAEALPRLGAERRGRLFERWVDAGDVGQRQQEGEGKSRQDQRQHHVV